MCTHGLSRYEAKQVRMEAWRISFDTENGARCANIVATSASVEHMAVTCGPLLLAGFRKVCAIALFALCAQAASGQSASYRIHISFDHPLRATVDAQLEAPDGVVFTAEQAGGYAWWEFIRNPRELLEDGRVLPLQAAGSGRWTIPNPTSGPVRLSYDVDLSFTDKVRVGDLRGGLFFGNALYIVNRALFLQKWDKHRLSSG